MSRLWVDANVILQFLTKDSPEMAERSARLMAKAEMGEASLCISPLVFAEVIWVLKSFYRYSMTAIARLVMALVSAPGIEVDRRELIIRTVELARDRNVDFADAYWCYRQPYMVRMSAPSARAISGAYPDCLTHPGRAIIIHPLLCLLADWPQAHVGLGEVITRRHRCRR